MIMFSSYLIEKGLDDVFFQRFALLDYLLDNGCCLTNVTFCTFRGLQTLRFFNSHQIKVISTLILILHTVSTAHPGKRVREQEFSALQMLSFLSCLFAIFLPFRLFTSNGFVSGLAYSRWTGTVA